MSNPEVIIGLSEPICLGVSSPEVSIELAERICPCTDLIVLKGNDRLHNGLILTNCLGTKAHHSIKLKLFFAKETKFLCNIIIRT